MSTGLRVLVVDDNEDVAASLSTWLKLEGHDVRTALDGRQALIEAREFTPSCVLLDISMPDMDGREVARVLRAAYGQDLVLIAVTGWEDPSLRTTSMFADFDHYVRKPIDLELLGKILDMVMLTVTGGEERTEEEYGTLLAKAGLCMTRVVPTASAASIVEAVVA